MKHVFIINPAAGKADRTASCSSTIRQVLDAQGLDYEIHVSRCKGDCEQLARAAAATGEEMRLYACGGDGTLNEVVNGAVGFSNAAVTSWPGGSGNDFVRLFENSDVFSDLSSLLDCEESAFDLIRCHDRYAINVCSMGFDARIGTQIDRYKRLPLVTGSGAYVLSIIVNTIAGVHQHMVLDLDDVHLDEQQTLVCISNGQYYGGGFHPTPEARPDDGILDVLVVRAVSRLTVARVIAAYKSGHYARFPDLIRHYRCRTVRVRCDCESDINLDGELLHSSDVTFSVEPQKIRVFYPRSVHFAPSPSEILSKST